MDSSATANSVRESLPGAPEEESNRSANNLVRSLRMSSGAYRLAPWITVARPHEDVTRGALDMGTYAANLAGVFRRRPGVPDVDTRRDAFVAATYPTSA